ncbi:hypothetical protein [Bacillus thuringiensis]|uniref:hypothetical protein n=1 Tax=Bacillus thuringiensis TaxID=1428 RepID=UPI0015F313FA|nr:hypothetical protein [Bacillus thuringiensis]
MFIQALLYIFKLAFIVSSNKESHLPSRQTCIADYFSTYKVLTYLYHKKRTVKVDIIVEAAMEQSKFPQSIFCLDGKHCAPYMLDDAPHASVYAYHGVYPHIHQLKRYFQIKCGFFI